MRYLSTYTPHARSAPSREQMAEMGRFVEESLKSGALLATGGLMPIAKGGARVRCAEGEITVHDGPFTESKELIGGFALLEAKSREEALEMTRKFLKVAGDGECDLYQLMDPGDGCPSA